MEIKKLSKAAARQHVEVYYRKRRIFRRVSYTLTLFFIIFIKNDKKYYLLLFSSIRVYIILNLS
jgi:hypothetical protein